MRNLDSNEIIIHNLKQCNYRDEIENLINGIQDKELQELVKKEYETTLKEMLKIGCCERNIIETIKNKLEIIVEENIKKDYNSLKEVIKNIEKRYEEEKNLMIKEIQKNNVDIQEYVEELFLFNELLQFLKYEDEKVYCVCVLSKGSKLLEEQKNKEKPAKASPHFNYFIIFLLSFIASFIACMLTKLIVL